MLKTLAEYLNTCADSGFGCLGCSPEELPGLQGFCSILIPVQTPPLECSKKQKQGLPRGVGQRWQRPQSPPEVPAGLCLAAQGPPSPAPKAPVPQGDRAVPLALPKVCCTSQKSSWRRPRAKQ